MVFEEKPAILAEGDGCERDQRQPHFATRVFVHDRENVRERRRDAAPGHVLVDAAETRWRK
jgi:hypothetical protein